MGFHTTVLSEELLECPLCLCVFTDPVCTPCGHSFCLNCISDHWSNCQQWRCPSCNEVFLNRPRLSVNDVLAKLTRPSRRTGLEKAFEVFKQPFRSKPHPVLSISGAHWVLLLLFCLLAVVIAYYTTHSICQQDTSMSPSRLAELCDQRVTFQDHEGKARQFYLYIL
ncbi:E3 ubiquitin/ISG15 ligase TRIM25-like [Engraulis encrasicolus]|uniref:E3 ubiquitin/ISG15 ligase TRIM25-like n=1 Tax=Engraulis encrasicolus TaxID=184585 RepID=UPI002FD08FBF